MAEVSEKCILEQRLNPLTGQSEWIVVKLQSESEVDDYDDPGASKERGESLGHTQYLDMLNDVERNRAYDQAIRKAVAQGAHHVLDIGAGTGLLSMMASRAMREVVQFRQLENDGDAVIASSVASGKVTACESYLPMVRLARKLLRANNIGASVRLVHKRSDEMEIGVDLSSTADVLVSEILDSELIGEGLIPTLRHAHAHLLSPVARSVPHRAVVYAQLVECDYLRRGCDLSGFETEAEDGLRLDVSKSRIWFSGFSRAMHVDPLVSHLKVLSKPFEVFQFNFCEVPADHREHALHVRITNTGNLHALISWWMLDLDDEGTITYSTAPAWTREGAHCHRWRDHWRQCVWYFPGDNVKVFVGQSQIIEAIHDEINVKYKLRSSGEREGQGAVDESTSHASVLRPERISLLGSQKYRRVLKEAVVEAVRQKSSPLCLIVDDSVLCTLLAGAANSDAHVITMLPGCQLDGASYIRAAAHANGLQPDQIKVFGRKAVSLTSEQLNGRKVDVLIAEPYYRAYEDLLPWRHLRFWYERTSLAPLLAENAVISPCKGVLRGVFLHLPDLWQSRRSLSSVEGFDHSSLNQVLGACGEMPSSWEGPLVPYSIWQCGRSKELTDKFFIMEFDFTLTLQAVQGSVKVPVLNSGLCHGVALWIDWVMDTYHQHVISTAPTDREPNDWKQGIKLLNVPVQLLSEEDSSLTISAAFNPQTGDIAVEVDTYTS
ncbi:hypothetical protein Mapa_005906 [Marchantia paleacea]|nr:hypothetical protein Mapa_005906 [Marchantia paleacea]